MTAGRSPALSVGAVLFAALAASAPAETLELWSAETDGDACRLELVNELGGVRLAKAPAETSVAVVRGGTGLAIASSVATGLPRLAVTRTGPPADVPAEVELLVPRGCRVTVRTTGGEVTLEIAREAFSAAVQTATGDITAWIDPAADAAFAFATSGEITTDFSVEIDFRYHAEPAKHGQITSSPDSPSQGRPNRVQLISRRGAIRMLRPDASDASHRDARAETRDDRYEPD